MAPRRNADERRMDQRIQDQRIAATAVDRLRKESFKVEDIDAQTVLVEGRYEISPLTGYWKDRQRAGQLGFGARSLIERIAADRKAAQAASQNDCAACKPAPVELPKRP